MKDYIFLSFPDNKSCYEAGELVLDNTKSWYITYEKDENCFACQNLSTCQITVMKSVENFLKIWIKDVIHTLSNVHMRRKIKISLYIQDQLLSEYSITRLSSEIQYVDIASYVSTLKDVIVTKDSNDKQLCKVNK